MIEKAGPAKRLKRPVRTRGLHSRLRDEVPAPAPGLALARIRSTRGLYASLSAAGRELWDRFDGPEIIGPSREPLG